MNNTIIQQDFSVYSSVCSVGVYNSVYGACSVCSRLSNQDQHQSVFLTEPSTLSKVIVWLSDRCDCSYEQ